MSEDKAETSIPVSAITAWHGEEVDRLNRRRAELDQLRQQRGEAGISADPNLIFALGKVEGQKDVLDGLTAFVVTKVLDQNAQADPEMLTNPDQPN